MKIIILLTILVSLTLFSCKDKISTAEDKPPIVKTDYFPLAIGNSWTYKYAALWGSGIFPEGYRDSSAGTFKWLITDYNAGIFTVKEVKTDSLKDTTYINYFTITTLDSFQIKLGNNLTLDPVYETLVRYYYATESDTVNDYRRTPYHNVSLLLQLKKTVGIVYYSTSYAQQGDWGSNKVELISTFTSK